MSTIRVGFILVCIAIIALALYVIVQTGRLSRSDGNRPITQNYRSNAICSDAWQHDFRPDANADHFDLTLREGCFDGTVYLPARFYQNGFVSFYWQPLNPDPDWWIAIWYADNSNQGKGPFGPAQLTASPLREYTTSQFRLQGKGRVRIYTNAPPLAFPERNQTPR